MNTIFHPTAFSSEPNMPFAHILKLAWTTKSQLSLFHVNERLEELNWQDFPSVSARLTKWDLHSSEHHADRIPHSNNEVETIFYRGKDPLLSILHHLNRHSADLIVLATYQLGGQPFFHSISEPVARKFHRMTFFILLSTQGCVSQNTGNRHLKNILIPIEYDPEPRVAFHAISTMLNVFSCEPVSVTVLYVGKEDEMPLHYPSQRDPDTWNPIVRCDEVGHGILSTEQELEAALIVMPTQGHHGFLDALRGSTTEQIVCQARCPILPIPND